jgi:hypothetical protein
MKLFKKILFIATVVVATPFEYCKEQVMSDLHRLVTSAMPSPQQVLLVKQTRHVMLRLAESQRCESLVALLQFTQFCFRTLNNRQLTLLNDIMRRLLIGGMGHSDIILYIAHEVKVDLDIDVLQYPGFFEDPARQDAFARIIAAQARYSSTATYLGLWIRQADLEELFHAADSIELLGSTIARVSEEHQVSVLRTFRGASDRDGPSGRDEWERMNHFAALDKIVRDPETAAIAVRWANILRRIDEPMKNHILRNTRLFERKDFQRTTDHFHRLADMLETMSRVPGPLPASVTHNARQALSRAGNPGLGDWSVLVEDVMAACSSQIIPVALPTAAPETSYSYAQLALRDVFSRPASIYPDLPVQFPELLHTLVIGAAESLSTSTELTRLRGVASSRMSVHRWSAIAYTPEFAWDQFVNLAYELALKFGHRVLVDQADAVRAAFPTLTDGAIDHLRMIIASLIALNNPIEKPSQIIKGAMTESELAPIRNALEGLARAYREFHQNAGTHYIEFLPLNILTQTKNIALVNDWLASDSGFFGPLALRGWRSVASSLINEWNTPLSKSVIAVEDFLKTNPCISMMGKDGRTGLMSTGIQLPGWIYLSERYQIDPSDEKLRLAKRKAVFVWMEIVETLYRNPYAILDDQIQVELLESLAAIYGKFSSRHEGPDATTEVAQDYERIYENIAAVLRRIRGEPEPTSTTTHIPGETIAEPTHF